MLQTNLLRCKYKGYPYKIFKKLEKYFKKNLFQWSLLKMTDRLSLAYSTTNIWVSHRLILESWPREFLSLPSQSQPSVSRDFGAPRRRHIPPALTTIYSPMDWGLGRRRPVTRCEEIWDVLLQLFLHFFLLWILLKAPSSLSLNTVSFRYGKTSFNMAP